MLQLEEGSGIVKIECSLGRAMNKEYIMLIVWSALTRITVNGLP